MNVNYVNLAWAILFILALVPYYGMLTRTNDDGGAGAGCILLLGVPILWFLSVLGLAEREHECWRGASASSDYNYQLPDGYQCQPWGWMWFLAPSVLSFIVFVICLVRKWTKE